MTEKIITIALSGSLPGIGKSTLAILLQQLLKDAGFVNTEVEFSEESMLGVGKDVLPVVAETIKNEVKLVIVDGGLTKSNSPATYIPVKFQNLNSRNDIPPDMLTAVVADVEYLRTRNRWTHDLENTLIELHKSGTPPNMMSFGSTKETQQALLDEAEKATIGITTIQRMDQSFLTQYRR